MKPDALFEARQEAFPSAFYRDECLMPEIVDAMMAPNDILICGFTERKASPRSIFWRASTVSIGNLRHKPEPSLVADGIAYYQRSLACPAATHVGFLH